MSATSTMQETVDTTARVKEAVERIKACVRALDEAKTSLDNMTARQTALAGSCSDQQERVTTLQKGREDILQQVADGTRAESTLTDHRKLTRTAEQKLIDTQDLLAAAGSALTRAEKHRQDCGRASAEARKRFYTAVCKDLEGNIPDVVFDFLFRYWAAKTVMNGGPMYIGQATNELVVMSGRTSLSVEALNASLEAEYF